MASPGRERPRSRWRPRKLGDLARRRGPVACPRWPGARGLGAPGSAAADWTPPGLVVTGVLTARGCRHARPGRPAVHPLLPHDADVMLESAGADLVLVEAAAHAGRVGLGLRGRSGRG